MAKEVVVVKNGLPWYGKVIIIGGIAYLIWWLLFKRKSGDTFLAPYDKKSAYKAGLEEDYYIQLRSNGLFEVDWRLPYDKRKWRKVTVEEAVKNSGRFDMVKLFVTGGASVTVRDRLVAALQKAGRKLAIARKKPAVTPSK